MYKIYAGTIVSATTDEIRGLMKATGMSYTSWYKWTSRTCIYDPSNKALATAVLSPVLTRESNKAGSLTFSMPLGNVANSALSKLISVVSVEQDGEEIWMGRVISTETDWWKNQSVTCEGELAFLNDVGCRVSNQVTDLVDIVAQICTGVNSSASLTSGTYDKKNFDCKRFSYSQNTIDLTRENVNYCTAWDALNTYIIDRCPVYTWVEKEKTAYNGTDYYARLLYCVKLEDLPVNDGQSIVFGQNILDLTNSVTASDIITQVTAYGVSVKTKKFLWWKLGTDTKVYTSTVTNTNEQSGVKRYGVIEEVICIDGEASTQDSVAAAAKAELEAQTERVVNSISVSAIDLKDAGYDCDRIKFMHKHQITSFPHNVDTSLPCVKITEPLDHPDQKSYTFGITFSSLSDLQALTSKQARLAYQSSNDAIGYLSGN